MNRTLQTAPPLEVFAEEPMAADALEVLLADSQGLARVAEAAEQQAPVPVSVPGIVIGTLVDLSETGQPIVAWADRAGERRQAARSIVSIDRRRLGAEVALGFQPERSQQPIILGLLVPNEGPDAPIALQATVDGDRLELTADREIMLRCGKASITLTRAGKVIIRGEYLLSRSAGVNRIKGGSVQIN